MSGGREKRGGWEPVRSALRKRGVESWTGLVTCRGEDRGVYRVLRGDRLGPWEGGKSTCCVLS